MTARIEATLRLTAVEGEAPEIEVLCADCMGSAGTGPGWLERQVRQTALEALVGPRSISLAEAVHNARFTDPRHVTPYAIEGRHGREYCERIATAVERHLRGDPEPLPLQAPEPCPIIGDTVAWYETTDEGEPGTVDAFGNIRTTEPGKAISRGAIWVTRLQARKAHRYGWRPDVTRSYPDIVLIAR